MSADDRPDTGSEWPVPDAARTALASRARAALAVDDLFMPAEDRLRDDDRATISRLLWSIVDRIERSFRLHLAVAFADHAALADALAAPRISIARPILERAGALRDPALVAALARRAQEGRVIARLWAERDRAVELEPDAAGDPVENLAAHPDRAIAAAAARLLAAGRSRRDPFGAPVPGPAELPAEIQHRLVWRVAAALRDYVVTSRAVPPDAIDPPIAQAAARVLAGYDEGETLVALAMSLAHALHAADRLDDGLIVGAVVAGDVGFAGAALAARAGIGFDPAWEMLFDHERLLLLCRAAGLATDQAAAIAVRLAPGGDDEALADRILGYDSVPLHRASAALAIWRLDPAYLDSIAALGAGR